MYEETGGNGVRVRCGIPPSLTTSKSIMSAHTTAALNSTLVPMGCKPRQQAGASYIATRSTSSGAHHSRFDALVMDGSSPAIELTPPGTLAARASSGSRDHC